MAAYSNDVAALNPQNWADAMQENLYKELVAMKIADLKFKSKLSSGSRVHFPMFGSLSVTSYTKGTDVTVQALDSTDEYLDVDQQYESSFYLDTIDKKQNLYSAMEAGVKEATYAIKNQIDNDFFDEVLNASDTVDTGDLSASDTGAGTGIALTTTNVIQAFSVATKKLADLNVFNEGDFVAVVTPRVASVIEQKATGVGFNLAEAAFKNGYAGDFMGYKIYVSNNLDTTTNSSDNCYIGKAKQISLALQIAPTVQIDNDPLKFGSIVKYLAVWGTKTFTKNAKRFLNLQIASAV
jgi:hypothetical protein